MSTAEVVVHNQEEWDALPKEFDKWTDIAVVGKLSKISATPVFAKVHIRDGAFVDHVYGSAQIRYVYGSAQISDVYGSAQIQASDTVTVHVTGPDAVITLAGFAIAFLHKKAKVILKSATAQKVVVKWPTNLQSWLDYEGVKQSARSAVIYKRVSKDFKTQERTSNETLWQPGTVVTHPAWSPRREECGEGKLHACSSAIACSEFRKEAGDKFVAIEVKKSDFYFWKNGTYSRKIAFREGKVLFECDEFGTKIE